MPTIGLQDGTDVFDLFDSNAGSDFKVPTQAAQLRNQLSSVTIADIQPEVWQEGIPLCSDNKTNDYLAPDQCYQGGTTFTNISLLLNPYIAQLPAGYQTGLIPQFLPRMNSSVSYGSTPQSDFPQDCKTNPAKYYIDYSYNETLLNLQVCMPTNVSHSPWKSTRDRQDISEEMFLSINTAHGTLSNATFKLEVNTTLGYFELPNYNGGGVAGPLLTKNPIPTCNTSIDICASESSPKRSLKVTEGQSSSSIFAATNLGPLGLMVVALFEQGSYLSSQFNPPASNVSGEDEISPFQRPLGPCTVAPLSQMMADIAEVANLDCQSDPIDVEQGYSYVINWLQNFYNKERMQNAMHAGVILASQDWLGSVHGSLTINHDLGEDSERPKISSTGVILLSVLLAIDLILLFGLATYSALSPKWASGLDSTTMLRQGAARADDLLLQIIHPGKDDNFRTVLEQMPGWVGDAAPEREVGVLAVGASTALKSGRKYCAA